ncbi:hypothetical protein PG993_014854 [Apiospora rasikravindrae]|uniref:Uncharacterized protein n=1 Tax=Apiospora rasikravindrae TaxID=990691 RepID=A0ABR1RNX3_9PEZI
MVHYVAPVSYLLELERAKAELQAVIDDCKHEDACLERSVTRHHTPSGSSRPTTPFSASHSDEDLQPSASTSNRGQAAEYEEPPPIDSQETPFWSPSYSHHQKGDQTWAQEWDQTRDDSVELAGITQYDEIGAPAPVLEATEWKAPELEKRTRLHDNGWNAKSHIYVRIPSVVGWSLLTEAYDLAQGAVHDFSKSHLRRLWKAKFRGGRHEVRLESDEIESILGYWDIPDTLEIYYAYFAHALRKARLLRNAVSHFRGQWWDGDEYDEHLKFSHALAVAVGDAARAERVRELRDELRDVAKQTLEEIEALGVSSIVPIERDREAYHESFFLKFYTLDHEDICAIINGFRFSPAVELALRAWRWQEEICDTADSSAVDDDKSI